MQEPDSQTPEVVDPEVAAEEVLAKMGYSPRKISEILCGARESSPAIAEAPASPTTQVGTRVRPAAAPRAREVSEQLETLSPQKLYALGVLSPSAVDRLCAEESKTEFLIEEFLPAKSIAIVGGDSGIGKSPLICQLALCLAAGIPFLGLRTHRGRVLYFDLENSLVDCKAMRDALTGFLGLPEAPYDDFLLVPEPADFERLNKLIEELRPRLIVIDSLRAFAPQATERNAIAGEWLKEIRSMVHKYGCAFLIVHHLRKPKLDVPESDLSEETRAMDWLLEMEGPRAFVNQTDVRIAIANGDGKLVALKAKWSRRVRGDSPLYLLERVFEEGEPVGYRPLTGRDFLNPEQRKALDILPNEAEWGFREARQALGQATSVDNPALPAPANRANEFLHKCVHFQVIKKLAKNCYRKVQKGGVAGVDG